MPVIVHISMCRYLIPPLIGHEFRFRLIPLGDQTHVLLAKPAVFELVASGSQTSLELDKSRTQFRAVVLRDQDLQMFVDQSAESIDRTGKWVASLGVQVAGWHDDQE